MCFFGIFGLEFENTIVMFEISTLEFRMDQKCLIWVFWG